MCIKGFVNRLSHDSDLDIERDVSTAYCRSSSGDRVDLLSRTIYSPVIVSSWMVGGFRTIKVLLELSEEENVPSEVRSGTVPLLTYSYCKFPYVRCFWSQPPLCCVSGAVPTAPCIELFFPDPIDATKGAPTFYLSIGPVKEFVTGFSASILLLSHYSHFIIDGRYFLILVYWWLSRKSYIHDHP